MTTGILFLDLFIGGILGIACHVFFLKLPGLKKRAKNAKTDFSTADYFKDDWITLAGSVLSVVVCMWVFDEIIGAYPAVVKWAKFFFIFVGYTGSSVLQGIFSKADAKIQGIVDEKTN